MTGPVKVAFASATAEAIPAFLEKFDAIAPELELVVVSEFKPSRGRWVPFRIDRSLADNRERLRAALGGSEIRLAATLLQRKTPYRSLQRMAFLMVPHRTLLYNENLDHFMLRPKALPQIGRHLFWRVREHVRWQVYPGGNLYTYIWRMRHPKELRRPIFRIASYLMGSCLTLVKAILPPRVPLQPRGTLPVGFSVVIPSRSGRHLLQQLIPQLQVELEGYQAEIIVVDNGSDDGTGDWLRAKHPQIRLEEVASPLSFARAVNRGIQIARYHRLCLLNNDMEPHPQFVAPLLKAFKSVPDLFCATAQIFFPPGQRRQETGKAVMRQAAGPDHDSSFPVYCALPVAGEDLSYVLYGSGGCSVYDTAKLRALGGVGEVYEPAYVEDLDLGFRAWQAGWPTVFAAKSQITHHHRTTTSKYYTESELDLILEVNYLRFLVRSLGSFRSFRGLWNRAILRLDFRAALERHEPSLQALAQTWHSFSWLERPLAKDQDESILALTNGDVAVFPGRADPTGKSVVMVCTCYIPYPLAHGGAVRMYNLIKRAARDFAQVLVTFVDDLHTPADELLDICVEVVQVRRLGSHVRRRTTRPDVVDEFDSASFRAALRQTARKWSPRIAQMEFTQMAQYSSDCAPAKTILVEHDVTIDLYQQLLRVNGDLEIQNQLQRWEAFETAAWRDVDCVVVMSEKDCNVVEGAKRVVALRNGVDLQRFRPSLSKPEGRRILFIGSFAHLPNLLALKFFVEQVWPLLAPYSPVLHVIAGSLHRYHFENAKGQLGFALDQPGFEVEDFVSDVRPAYERATIVIAPLLASAGTNIKIMEAMAMGKAIVSTSGGVNGLDLVPGHDLMIEDDPSLFGRAICALIDNPEARRRLEKNARITVERLYDWDRIAAQQKSIYEELLKS